MLGLKILLIILTVLIGYFLGCFNGALLISKYILHNDVRQHGSGNAGLTNFYRVFGGKLTLAVILCDMLKTVIAVVIGILLLGQVLGMPILGRYVAGVACMVGHMYPCMFHFKGGKGILVSGTLSLMTDWRIIVVSWGVFILVVLLSRMVSLGSMCGGVAFFVMTVVIYRGVIVSLLGAAVCLLIFWQHRSNIVRIARGEENRFSFRRNTSDSEGKT